MRDAILKGLAMKGVWQAKEIEKTGKVPIIFFDEPYLSDFGSAFVPLERTKVIEMLNEVIHILKQKTGARAGIRGVVAWGLVPTAEYRASVNLNEIRKKFRVCLENLASKGLNTNILLRQSLITPSCGAGLMREADATMVHNLTSELSADFTSA